MLDDVAVKNRVYGLIEARATFSLKKHWDKAVNNASIAKTVEVYASKGVKWVMFSRICDWRRGPSSCSSLGSSKQSNGFSRFQSTRYYVPMTRKGNQLSN